MSDRESEDERLAAFLDGRMDARRRSEMLAHLTRTEEDRAVLAATAAILRQMEEEEAAAAPGEVLAPAAGQEHANAADGAIPLDVHRPLPTQPDSVHQMGRRALRWTALAAVLAGLALVTGRALRPGASIGGEPVRLAARLEHGTLGLPSGWTDRRPWTSARGDVPGGASSPRERAVRSARAGAMLVDLSVAVEAGDSAETRALASQIAARFDPQGGRRGALREIADGAGSNPERLRPLVGEATERIAKRLDPDALRLGAWTEAAALAAARQDAGFFRDGETRQMLDSAARGSGGDPAAAAVQQVRLLLTVDPPRWEVLSAAIDALAREIATE